MRSNSSYSPSPGAVCCFIIRIDFCSVELCLPPLSDQRGQVLPWGEEGAVVEAQPCLLTALAGAEARGWLIRDRRGAEERPSDKFGTGRSAIQACRQAVLECTAQITKRGPSAEPATTSSTVSGCCCPLCLLLSPLSLPSIPIPRHGFWGRPNCCSSSGSLSPAPHDV